MKEITSLKQYLDQIFKLCKKKESWFRGQPKDDPLKPKIGRLPKNKLKISLSAIERYLFDHFGKYGYQHINLDNFNLWDQLCIAQHHGLPTRLLDWSHCPLTALFFSLWQKSQSNAYVYILNPNFHRIGASEDFTNINPFEIKNVYTFTPSHKTERIVSQRGNFTVHNEPFNQFMNNNNYEIKKICISKRNKDEIRFHLEKMFGINEFTLFPGLDSIGHHLKWKVWR